MPSIWKGNCRSVVVVILTLLVYGSALGWLMHVARGRIQGQIIARDAEVLNAVAVMLQYEDLAPEDSAVPDPSLQFPVLLKASKIKGVIAARLYDQRGRPVATFPANVTEGALYVDQMLKLAKLAPISRFESEGDPSQLFLETQGANSRTARVPLLYVHVPLHGESQKRLNGVAEFILDGENVAFEFATLDRSLMLLGLAVFFVGSIVIVSLQVWAFRKLQRSNALLVEQGERLREANEELALAAKTSAIGAITAHWLHDLKSPIFGLQTFVAGRAKQESGGRDKDWNTALHLMGQLQGSINEMMGLMRQDSGGQQQVELSRMLADLVKQFEAQALTHRVKVEVSPVPVVWIAGQYANLIAMVLGNLVRNSIEASGVDSVVLINARTVEDGMDVEVQDRGPGLPEFLENGLFKPCVSSKPRGSGVGLAISKQLAKQLGGELSLRSSSPDGCTFVLRVPRRLLNTNFNPLAA